MLEMAQLDQVPLWPALQACNGGQGAWVGVDRGNEQQIGAGCGLRHGKAGKAVNSAFESSGF